MKKLILVLLITLSLQGFSQDWEVVDYEGKSASEIQTELRTWIALNFRSAQNVIQQDDPGKLIAKGGSTVMPIYDDGRFKIPLDWPYRYTLHFEIRDNRFRFSISDIYIEPIVEGRKYSHGIDEMIHNIEERNEKLKTLKGTGNIRRERAAIKSNIDGVKEIQKSIEDLKLVIKNIPNQKVDDDDW